MYGSSWRILSSCRLGFPIRVVHSYRAEGGRAYSEMVDLLWMTGQEAAAVSLEVRWNQLIARGKCSLLCGYASDRVARAPVRRDL